MIKKIIGMIKSSIPEILFSSGLFFIDLTTFLLNYIAGMYTTGIILVGLGIFLARLPTERR